MIKQHELAKCLFVYSRFYLTCITKERMEISNAFYLNNVLSCTAISFVKTLATFLKDKLHTKDERLNNKK